MIILIQKIRYKIENIKFQMFVDKNFVKRKGDMIDCETLIIDKDYLILHNITNMICKIATKKKSIFQIWFTSYYLEFFNKNEDVKNMRKKYKSKKEILCIFVRFAYHVLKYLYPYNTYTIWTP